MKKRLKSALVKFLNSKLALPFSVMIIFIVVAGAVILIFESTANRQFGSLFDGIWWAVITFSTTGYGDKVPISPGGRITAMISVFVGIVAMGYLSGTLASVFVERNTKARRGFMDYARKKNHFVICGWKDHIHEILLEILKLNRDIGSEDIVVISNVDDGKVEDLKREDRLAGLCFVKGDYFSEPALRRANVAHARRVLVLADTLESRAPSEVDSKTVITALTIRTISKDVYVCVELLDNKFEDYLKTAMCDEIILARDYTRMILANSSSTSGISHVIYDMLSPDKGTSRLLTCPIPQEFVNRKFAHYKRHFQASTTRMLLGILENTGSVNKMKVEALREAQKTPDISMIVSNLQQVKGLQANRPMLVPADDYVIKKYSLGIVLESILRQEGGRP
jgi:voltage-gated potassium channel